MTESVLKGKTLLFALVFLFSAAVQMSFAADLPQGYSTVQLGMSMDETKEALGKDTSFGFRGDRDVSLLPGSGSRIIETRGNEVYNGILSNCWFQFYEDSLYIITITMNSARMDYYSIFRTLCSKYGNPETLSPEKCLWKNDSVQMTLEKPLTLRYVDLRISQAIQEESRIEQAWMEEERQDFLNGL